MVHDRKEAVSKVIKAGIIGSTGYAGEELVRLLLGHKDVQIAWYGSQSYAGKKYQEVYRNMFQIVDARCIDEDLKRLGRGGCHIYSDTAGVSGIQT